MEVGWGVVRGAVCMHALHMIACNLSGRTRLCKCLADAEVSEGRLKDFWKDEERWWDGGMVGWWDCWMAG